MVSIGGTLQQYNMVIIIDILYKFSTGVQLQKFDDITNDIDISIGTRKINLHVI